MSKIAAATADKSEPIDWRAPVPVKHMWFVDALDFNAEQKSNVPCSPELTPAGSSYICQYLPAWDSFELTCGRNGKVTEVRQIPRERIKQWIVA